MAFQWAGMTPLNKGVSLGWTPQKQVIGDPKNAANLNAMMSSLTSPTPAAAVAPQGMMGIPNITRDLSGYKGRIGPRYIGQAQGAMDAWNKNPNKTLEGYLAVREGLDRTLNQGLQMRHGSGRGGRGI